ncbi:MAG: DUF896 domain-containing protein [Firmicutes bacterium]|nr:DUF896 domain-containing protein [Bacillota bacterium]
MKQEKIDRINALAKKAKSADGLTAEEIVERETLRAEYLAAIRANFKNTLDSVKFVDKEK